MPVVRLYDAGQTLLARVTSPLSWRSGPRAVARLRAFALAEQNTMIELEQAANLTPEPRRAASYLLHAADEARHARMFTARARALAQQHGLPPPPAPHADSAALFSTLGEVDFLAFVHRGEARGRARFEGWERAFRAQGDLHTASLFAALVADERRHEAYALALLRELAGESGARRALYRVALWEAWRGYLALAASTSRRLYRWTLLLCAPLLWVSGAWARWALPERAGWRSP